MALAEWSRGDGRRGFARLALTTVGALSMQACGDPEVFFLSTDGLASLLLVRVNALGAEVTAHDVPDSTPLERDPPGAATLFVAGYGEPLAALGLAPGPVALAPNGGLLPRAQRYHRFRSDGWEDLARPPEELTALRLAELDRCAVFSERYEPLPIEAGESVTFAIELDDARVLLATDRGRFFQATTAGLSPLTTLATTTPSLAAFRAADGELWLAGAEGRVMHGTIEGGFVEAPPVPLDARAGLVLDGARDGAPHELFAADGTLAVAHFDGARWRRIAEPVAPLVRSFRARIGWLEPGLAMLLGVGTASVAEIEAPGRVRIVPFQLRPRSATDGPWALEYVDGRGVVMGTRYSALYVRSERGLDKLVEPPISPRADVMVDLGARSVLAGGQGGDFVQLRAQGDFCEPVRFAIGTFAHAAARLGSGIVLVGSTDGERVTVAILERLR